LVINNIEYDHADIFHDLDAIRAQFHNLVRIMPENSKIIYPLEDDEIEKVIKMGCWTPTETVLGAGADWSILDPSNDYRHFSILKNNGESAKVSWSIFGEHNACNALAAVVAAHNVGVTVQKACEALSKFKSVKRRLECIYQSNDITVYDDFAHHPTAIKKSLQAIKSIVKSGRLIVIMEPRSNSMRMGVHADRLSSAFIDADQIFLFQPKDLNWSIVDYMKELGGRCRIFEDIDKMIDLVSKETLPHDHIVFMSNGAFGNAHQKLINRLGEL